MNLECGRSRVAVRCEFFSEWELVKHVGERLCMHQPMFDCNIQQLARRKFEVVGTRHIQLVDAIVNSVANPSNVVSDLYNLWPVSRLVSGKSSINRIDAKRK